MARLVMRLLGTFEVRLDDAPVTAFAYDKVRALLAYLITAAGHPLRRERLTGLLWPDYPERSARQNLSQALFTLRNAIGDAPDPGGEPVFLDATRQTVEFARTPDAWSDVDTFNAAIRAAQAHAHLSLGACSSCLARLEEAVGLYRGDFLQDLTIDDSAAFEEWALAQREALHQQVLWALEQLADHAETEGDHDQALAYARRQIALEPWRESAHRQAMRALAVSGRRSEALAQFEACRRNLVAELGIEPDPSTRELYEAIRAGTFQPPTKPEARATLASEAPSASQRTRPEAPPAPPVQQPPATRPAEPAAAPDGERRWVTLVLVDVVGAQDLLRQEGAEAWAEVLGPLLGALAGEARRLGGDFRQTGGDRATVTFGVRAAQEDDPERAVLTALAMQQACADALRETGEGQLSLRVSIHRGEAIVTAVDGKPSAMGEVFAAAESVHAGLPPGATWVDASTYHLAAPAFQWQPLNSGYSPLAHLRTADKGRGLPGLSAPLVGRNRELQALQEAIDRLKAGVGGIVTLVGEAGIGKSRLVAEVRKSENQESQNQRMGGKANERVGESTNADSGFADSPILHSSAPRWIEGRCLSYATSTAFQMWDDVLRALAGAAGDASPIEVRAALYRTAEALCPDRFDDVYPLLAWLMALPLDEGAQARVRGIDAEGLRVLAFRAVESLLAGAASRAPLVVALEDLHWADTTSLELLEALVPLTESAPLLFLCVMRPETEHPCWHIRELAARDYAHRHTDLRLVPLSEAESAALVGHLLTIEALPGTLRARVLSHAEGNPFFLEELLRALIDTGAIAYDADIGHWHAVRDIAALPLPDTLHSVLASRIDRLPLEARQVLQVAAVIGRIVPLPLLTAVMGHNTLDDPLRVLQRAELVRERARIPEIELIFKHQLTQEAAYAGLLRRKRRTLHRRVAEAIEERYADRIDERLGLLAHHWEEAGDTQQAIAYLRRAGEQAAARFANDEAVDYLTRALALTPDADLEQKYDLLLHLEALYDHLGRREPQRGILDQLQAAAEALGRRTPDNGGELLAEVWQRRAHLGLVTSAFDESIHAAQRTIELARATGSIRHEALGHLAWGSALRGTAVFGQRGIEGEGEQLDEAVALAHQAQLPDVEAQALREMGLSYTGDAGRLLEALEPLGRCLVLYRQLGDRTGECLALTAIAMTHWFMGHLDAAHSTYIHALEMIRQVGHAREEGWALWGLGGVALDRWLFERSLGWLRSALQTFEAVNDEWGMLVVEVRVLFANYALGQYEEAETSGSRLIEGDAVGFRVRGRCMLSRTALRRENAQAALAYGSQALAEARACSAWYVAYALLVIGNAEAALCDLDGATASYNECIATRDSLNAPSPDALSGLASVALVQGRDREALELVDKALAHLDSVPFWDCAYDESQVYLTCWQVLRANGDARARGVLEKAYRAIRDAAGNIEDEALRRSFLENVPANREIGAAWESLQEHAGHLDTTLNSDPISGM